ncbi:hypothetical protein BpHYR1_030142 [Brachionus plicatilis]|uniref:Uncharacterized protein n=1 Tax=Brachionus plicatilis TaxID=10195 RepID=A0A3M7RM75_BRAPC|nr:hypothetical protein BpHYR1_030142 [Brachionus plicatilis]
MTLKLIASKAGMPAKIKIFLHKLMAKNKIASVLWGWYFLGYFRQLFDQEVSLGERKDKMKKSFFFITILNLKLTNKNTDYS